MSFKTIQKNPKALLVGAFVILFMMVFSLYLYNGVIKSADEIIQDNKNITQTAVKKLTLRANEQVEAIWEEHLRGKNKITKQEERVADSLLSQVVEEVLSNFHRLEGGYYFYELDEFVGYSFPTIDDPKPAFGPPPRSYNIIRNQARETISKDSLLTQLHRFDPAIFPLSTQPIYFNDELVAVSWARIHIERKLATSQNIQSGTFFLTIGAVLFGLFLTIITVWTLKMRMREIKDGLNKMKHDPNYRLKEYRGAFGVISQAINEMTDAQQKEQEKRKRLKIELYQQEKMATLGNLIAGTAHEINTPISIIKTRVQIWERALAKANKKDNLNSIVNDRSLKIVHTEIDRVSALIKRLLLFSKPISNKKTSVDLHHLLEKNFSRLRQAYPSHSIHIQDQFDRNLPNIIADEEAIDHVLMNILKNAVEASPETCRLVVSTIHLVNDDQVEIRIRDFGIGMSDEIKPRIFEPFFSTKNSGTGLGLSICNEIIKAHNGSISFQNPINSRYQVETWDQNTNIESIETTLGIVSIITLPIST